MAKLFFLFFALTFTGLIQCRDLWSAEFPEIKNLSLEKGKPIEVPDYYDKVQLCQLSGTIYSDILSQLPNVTELRICQSEIEEIESGALCASATVKSLELDFRDSLKVPRLKKEILDKCDNIEEFILKFNPYKKQTIEIDHNLLENLPNLKNLYILGYKLSHLQKNFLKLANTSLKVLVLSICDINQIDSNTFEDLPQLEKIALLYNRRLQKLPLKLFQNNLNLKTLLLNGNGLKNLTWDEFEGLNNLQRLELSENRITVFRADKIAKNMPHLKVLTIDRNPLRCKEREAFVVELKTKLENVDVTYKFDPGYYDSCEEE